MNRFIDSEARQLRVIGAMDALEDLLASQHPGSEINCGRLAALLGLTFDAMREALPLAERMAGGMNDDDED